MHKNLLEMPGDLLYISLTYLDQKSLTSFYRSSKESSIIIIDDLWKSLAKRRWNVSDITIKIIGADCWKTAYQIMTQRQKLPIGFFTEKYVVTFGKGRQNGIDSWILVGHTADARLTRYAHGFNTIEVRLCIQNYLNDAVDVLTSTIKIACRSEDESIVYYPIENGNVVAKNGLRVPFYQKSSDSITLYNLEYVVLSLSVICRADMIFYETDFLVRAQYVQFDILNNSLNSHPCCTFSIKAFFDDENLLWDHYMELPGGVVLFQPS